MTCLHKVINKHLIFSTFCTVDITSGLRENYFRTAGVSGIVSWGFPLAAVLWLTTDLPRVRCTTGAWLTSSDLDCVADLDLDGRRIRIDPLRDAAVLGRRRGLDTAPSLNDRDRANIGWTPFPAEDLVTLNELRSSVALLLHGRLWSNIDSWWSRTTPFKQRFFAAEGLDPSSVL